MSFHFYKNQTFTQWKIKVYVILLPVFFIAFALIFGLLVKAGSISLLNMFTFSALCIGLLSCFLLLLIKKNTFHFIELAISILASVIYVLRMYDTILIDLGVAGNVNLGTVSYWYPIFYFLLFITFRGLTAFVVSVCIFITTLLPGVYHVFFSGMVNSNTLDVIIQFFSANAGFIVALYFLQRVIETFLEAEVSKHYANTDYLTKLPNRRKMDSLLQQEIVRAGNREEPLTVILFDIDHFKKINDTYGHEIGDHILEELANLVKDSLRKSDFFGRWGGEEFLLIAVDTPLSKGITLSNRIKDLIATHDFKQIEGITCSFGVAEFENEDEAKDLLRRADNALYKAKEDGRNQVEVG